MMEKCSDVLKNKIRDASFSVFGKARNKELSEIFEEWSPFGGKLKETHSSPGRLHIAVENEVLFLE